MPSEFETDPTADLPAHGDAETADSGPVGAAGSRVGRYRLVEILGEGGFGVVWRAEQTEPMRREVAVKVIKPGMDSRRVVARFEAERQALAVMDHPCIARVLDGGTTGPEFERPGLPYFVMELVRGEPITAYCRSRSLPVRARLDLFARVCDAVQHAHFKGVVHRDIKPGNVLVASADAGPIPKVIDFGIAKALSADAFGGPLLTEQGQMIGTPQYMSPEQVDPTGVDVDARTDVYSLGVLLYELLTGTVPVETPGVRSRSLYDIQRMILEGEPPRPSTRLASMIGGERPGARSEARALRGDLDWIVMKCLEKDRSRRYETAAALGEDVRRHLRDEPVQAGPPSASYRLLKFARRRRVPLAAGAVVLLALVAGLALASAGFVQASRERDRARIDAARAERVGAFLAGIFAAMQPEIARTRDTTVLRELLERASARVGAELADEPEVEAEVRHAIAKGYRAIARPDEAERHARRAHDLLTRHAGPDDPRTLAAGNDLAVALHDLGRLEESRSLYAVVLDAYVRTRGPRHHETIATRANLAAVLSDLGMYDEAAAFYEEAVRDARAGFGAESEIALNNENNLASVLVRLLRYGEAERLARDALERSRRALGEDHPYTAHLLNVLGLSLNRQERLDEAEAAFAESLGLARAIFGDDHPVVVSGLTNLGQVRAKLGRLDEARVLLDEAAQRGRAVLGDDHYELADVLSNLAGVLHLMGRYEEAVPLLADAMRITRLRLGEDDLETILCANNLAAALEKAGEVERAEALYRDALERAVRVLGETHETTLSVMGNLALFLSEAGRTEEALDLGERTLAAIEAALGPSSVGVLVSAYNLAGGYQTAGRFERAVALYERCLTILPALPQGHWMIGVVHGGYGECLTAMGRFDDAEPRLLEAYGVLLNALGTDHERTRKAVERLVALYGAAGREDEAARWRALVPLPPG